MRLRRWIADPRTRLDITAGTVDGILNALILAAGLLLRPAAAVGLGLAFRVAAASALTTLFVFFVAHYAELRAELARAERQLNLTPHGRLAAGRLGRRCFQQAVSGAALAAGCGFVGAACPLLISVWLPSPRWVGPAVTVALLGVLGGALARSFRGSVPLWSAVIMVGGAALILAGVQLSLVS